MSKIAALTAERDKLKAALEEIRDHPGCGDYYCCFCTCDTEIQSIVDRALGVVESEHACDLCCTKPPSYICPNA